MAVIMRLREARDTSKTRGVEVLEWGISLEIVPRPDLLWLLALGFNDGGRWADALELLDQCHFALLSSGVTAAAVRGAAGPDGPPGDAVAGLLTWLGAGPSPSSTAGVWLPLAAACEICVDAVAKPDRGRVRGLRQTRHLSLPARRRYTATPPA
jgi:hypothetical protein